MQVKAEVRALDLLWNHLASYLKPRWRDLEWGSRICNSARLPGDAGCCRSGKHTLSTTGLKEQSRK